MATYCVVEALHTEWIITNALDEQECTQQGGMIVSRGGGGGCGSSAAAAHSYQGLSDSGIAGRTSALTLIPLRLFRSTFAESTVTARLDALNTLAADEVAAIFAAQPALGEQVRDAFLTLSLLAGALLGSSDAELKELYYSQELHDRLAGVAQEIARHAKDPAVRAGFEDITRTSERFAGQSLAEIKVALNRPARAA